MAAVRMMHVAVVMAAMMAAMVVVVVEMIVVKVKVMARLDGVIRHWRAV